MKNKLFKFIMLSTMFALPLCVNAEESIDPSTFNDEQTVVVGDVDSTVYSVDITWNDLSYDWKYDRATNSFDFKSSLSCRAIEPEQKEELKEYITSGDKIYTNDQCSIETDLSHLAGTEDFEIENTYYVNEAPAPTIQIEDHSVNGRIKANATFAPSGSYADWVTGKFYHFTTYDNNELEYHDELIDGYLPLDGTKTSGPLDTGEILGYSYIASLKLDINNEYTGEKVVESGSTIGTITLEISNYTE